MDNVAASRKLGELGIPEVVIQAEKDEVIGDLSLLNGLRDAGIVENKTFYVVTDATHNDVPDELLMEILADQMPRRGWWECIPLIGPWIGKMAG